MLNSDWLQRMIEKSGRAPRQRLLALFDILDDWIDAPLIRENLRAGDLGSTVGPTLLNFLEIEAGKAGAEHPQDIAHQLYLIALSALHREITHPGCGAMALGKCTAQTLLQQQLKKPGPFAARSRNIAAAASAAVFAFIAMVMGAASDFSDMPLPHPGIPMTTAPTTTKAAISPDQMARLYYSIEQLRHGTCQYPQALMLPEKYRKLYLDTVVGGVITAEPAQVQDLRQLLQKVDCYYPSQLNSLSVGVRPGIQPESPTPEI